MQSSKSQQVKWIMHTKMCPLHNFNYVSRPFCLLEKYYAGKKRNNKYEQTDMNSKKDDKEKAKSFNADACIF